MKTHFTALLAVASLVGSAHAVGVSGQGDWETTLQPRELDGNAVNGPEAFYDTALDITWLRNANVNGMMNWASANTWANTLAVASIAGPIGDWRLPTMVDTAAPGCDLSLAGGTDCGYNVQTATSEMAHLWYVALGNKAYCDPALTTVSTCSVQPGWGLTNTGNFQDVQAYMYWSGLGYAPNPIVAWYFYPYDGGQSTSVKADVFFALAVRTGDVAAVPEPQTYALMLMGLSALLLALRRRAG